MQRVSQSDFDPPHLSRFIKFSLDLPPPCHLRKCDKMFLRHFYFPLCFSLWVSNKGVVRFNWGQKYTKTPDKDPPNIVDGKRHTIRIKRDDQDGIELFVDGKSMATANADYKQYEDVQINETLVGIDVRRGKIRIFMTGKF